MQATLDNTIAPEKTNASPLRLHPQLPFISDILNRSSEHHLLLQGTTSSFLRRAFIDTLSALNENMDFIYLAEKSESSEEELALCISNSTKITVFVIDGEITQKVITLFNTFHHHTYARFIFFNETAQQDCGNLLTRVTWTVTRDDELISLLKTYKQSLENFYLMAIPEDIFSYAYHLTKHYIGTHSHFDSAMQLIDSTLARAKRTGQAIGTDTVAEVVSSMTEIPTALLHHNKLKSTLLIPALQQSVFGQETAIHLISSTLQSIPLQAADKNTSLSAFLFVGKRGVGKKKLATELARYLFGNENSLLQVSPLHGATTWLDLHVSTKQNESIRLRDAIAQKPYAVVLIENIEESFKTSGFLDEMLAHPAFQQAIVIITTTLANEKLSRHEPTTSQTNHVMDLMQLVLNENPLLTQTRDSSHTHAHEKTLDQLRSFFSLNLLQQVEIIPCLPLENLALDKIFRLKLEELAKTLHSRFQIELQYAPEVIKFLVHATNKQTGNFHTLEKSLEHFLYPCISHTVFSRMDHMNRHRHLFISLNDSGQLLKSEFVSHKEY